MTLHGQGRVWDRGESRKEIKDILDLAVLVLEGYDEVRETLVKHFVKGFYYVRERFDFDPDICYCVNECNGKICPGCLEGLCKCWSDCQGSGRRGH